MFNNPTSYSRQMCLESTSFKRCRPPPTHTHTHTHTHYPFAIQDFITDVNIKYLILAPETTSVLIHFRRKN